MNTTTPGHQAYPKVASSPAGEFLVVWDGFGQDGSSYGILAQRYRGDFIFADGFE